ncbi:hypothetical protein CMI47_22600 [Candidatus Pacearchaeota archaeon]|nr:hypothetical protein [Candidatus Pacearchaeota archaeon]
MLSKIQIQRIKRNSERVEEGLITRFREFFYTDTNSFVKPDTIYSVYYTVNKTQVYFTGFLDSRNSRKIIKVGGGKTMFEIYSKLNPTQRENYPENIQVIPTENDYLRGSITRYFAQKANDYYAVIFETTKDAYTNKSNLYRYVEFEWVISGIKSVVMTENRLIMNGINRDFPGISKLLFPLQLWRPSKNSPDYLQKKLSLVKNP